MDSTEKWDLFVMVLNPQTAFEVRNDNCMGFKEATRIYFRIEAAMTDLNQNITRQVEKDYQTTMEFCYI